MRRLAATTGALAGLLVMAGTASADGGSPLPPPKKTSEVIVRFHDQASASTRAAARASVGSSSVRRLLLANTQVLHVQHRARPGRPVVVKVKLRAVVRRAVVTVQATDAAGNSSVVKTRVRLRAP